MDQSVYCIDTSAFLDGYSRYYPPDVFPTLWNQMSGFTGSGRIISPRDVLIELEKRDDAAHAWAKQHRSIFIEVDRFQEAQVRQILAQYPRLVGAGRGRNQADSWVIALAQTQGGMVVTGERGGTDLKPKIPYICDQLGVARLPFLEMLRREGWSF
jgi:hypothetical protein